MEVEISLVIVNWNTKDLLMECLTSVFETIRGIPFEVWVVDNGSVDGSVSAVRKKFPQVSILENGRNLGFAVANNRAFEKMNGRYAVLLNTDAVLTEGAVEKLHGFMEKTPEAAMACGQLLNRDGSKQNSFANFPALTALLANETLLRIFFPEKFPSKRRDYKEPIEVDSCVGACMMVRKEAMDKVGLFDEDYFFFFEETDWAYRMKQADWKVFFVPSSFIYHLQGKSAGVKASARIMFYRSRYIYFSKWRPKDFITVHIILFFRLLVNFILNLAGLAVTLGFSRRIKTRLSVYTQLLLWHLSGCPDNR